MWAPLRQIRAEVSWDDWKNTASAEHVHTFHYQRVGRWYREGRAHYTRMGRNLMWERVEDDCDDPPEGWKIGWPLSIGSRTLWQSCFGRKLIWHINCNVSQSMAFAAKMNKRLLPHSSGAIAK